MTSRRKNPGIKFLIIFVCLVIFLFLLIFSKDGANSIEIGKTTYKSLAGIATQVIKNEGIVEMNEGDLNGIAKTIINDKELNNDVKINNVFFDIQQSDIITYAILEYKKVQIQFSTKGRIVNDEDNIKYLPDNYKVGKLILPKSVVINLANKYINNKNITMNEQFVAINKKVIPLKVDDIKLSNNKVQISSKETYEQYQMLSKLPSKDNLKSSIENISNSVNNQKQEENKNDASDITSNISDNQESNNKNNSDTNNIKENSSQSMDQNNNSKNLDDNSQNTVQETDKENNNKNDVESEIRNQKDQKDENVEDTIQNSTNNNVNDENDTTNDNTQQNDNINNEQQIKDSLSVIRNDLNAVKGAELNTKEKQIIDIMYSTLNKLMIDQEYDFMNDAMNVLSIYDTLDSKEKEKFKKIIYENVNMNNAFSLLDIFQ